MKEQPPTASEIREFLGWLEFGCWTGLLLAPIIYWLQGSSVSPDQFVIRTAAVVLLAGGAVVLRVAAIARGR